MDSYKPILMSQVKDIACDMRHDILTMVHNCGKQNGHLGGCMSAVEVLAVLYSLVMNINEIAHTKRDWTERDRFIMSKGHAGIAMYAAMKHVGLVSQEMIDGDIRGENTVLFRHPKQNIEFGIECSVGSLGMGLGYGIGLAESFRRKNTGQRVFVMLGDGECNEGAVWESAAYAGHRKLDNLIAVIDKNNLQLDGSTSKVLSMDNMSERWSAFGFQTVEVDGHDMEAVYEAFQIQHTGKPLAIIARTIKGKGVSFAENRTEWHDNYLSDELYQQALNELEKRNLSEVRDLAENRFRNKRIICKTENYHPPVNISVTEREIENCYNLGPRDVIGETAYQLAEQDDKFTLIFSDCGNRIGIQKILDKHPEKCYETGISEQNQLSMAAGMAHEGFHVFAVAYAPFITARVLDQIRTNLGYMKAPVCLIGLSAGFAGSDLGATHTAFEDIANTRCIPNMKVILPADSVEIMQTMEYLCNFPQPAYVRVTVRNPEPRRVTVSAQYDPYGYEKIKSGTEIAFVTCGSICGDVLEAEKLLGISASVYKLNSVKPLNREFLKEIKRYKYVISVEEHNVLGGFGSALSEVFSEDRGYPLLYRMGIQDCYFAADTAIHVQESSGLEPGAIAAAVNVWMGEATW
ncbi:MAG: hypothetical protein HFG69_06475 [Hungatella sp.]|nr:hypothetical protein [Hungatella sp.]